MAYDGSNGVLSAPVPNPTDTLTDFSLIVLLTRANAGDLFDAVTDQDATKFRFYKQDETTELAFDPFYEDWTASDEMVIFRVKWSGSLTSSGSYSLLITPAVTGNASYAATDTYGQYNAYDSNVYQSLPLNDDANDRTSNGNNATLNSLAFPTDAIAAPIGNGLQLDGTGNPGSALGDYITALPVSNSIVGNNTITFRGYIKPEIQSAGDEDAIISNWFGSEEGAIVTRYDSLNNEIDCFMSSSGTKSITNSVSIEGDWHHFAFVLGNNLLTAYIDGVALANTVSIPDFGTTSVINPIVYGGVHFASSDGFYGGLSQLNLDIINRSSDFIAYEYFPNIRQLYLLGYMVMDSPERGNNNSRGDSIAKRRPINASAISRGRYGQGDKLNGRITV